MEPEEIRNAELERDRLLRVNGPVEPSRRPVIDSVRQMLELKDARIKALEAAAPIPMVLSCPTCGERHIDQDEWAIRPHRTHRCQSCGAQWRPSHRSTVGVRDLGPKPVDSGGGALHLGVYGGS